MLLSNRSSYRRWREVGLILALGLGSISVLRITAATRTDPGLRQQQDVLRIEGRITQLEQRLYALETSVRTLEQSRISGMARGAGQDDVALLRAELQVLQRRLAVDECGLVKLDERTLPDETRAERRKAAGAGTDPCRMNVDTPLQLPDRR